MYVYIYIYIFIYLYVYMYLSIYPNKIIIKINNELMNYQLKEVSTQEYRKEQYWGPAYLTSSSMILMAVRLGQRRL